MSLKSEKLDYMPPYTEVKDGKNCQWWRISNATYGELLVRWDVAPRGWRLRRMITEMGKLGDKGPDLANVWHLWFHRDDKTCFILHHKKTEKEHRYHVTAVHMEHFHSQAERLARCLDVRGMKELQATCLWPEEC